MGGVFVPLPLQHLGAASTGCRDGAILGSGCKAFFPGLESFLWFFSASFPTFHCPPRRGGPGAAGGAGRGCGPGAARAEAPLAAPARPQDEAVWQPDGVL